MVKAIDFLCYSDRFLPSSVGVVQRFTVKAKGLHFEGEPLRDSDDEQNEGATSTSVEECNKYSSEEDEIQVLFLAYSSLRY